MAKKIFSGRTILWGVLMLFWLPAYAQKQLPSVKAPHILTSLKTVALNYTDTVISFDVMSNVDYSVTSSEDWCQPITKLDATTSNTLYFRVSANPDYYSRLATITLQNVNKSVSKTVVLTQNRDDSSISTQWIDDLNVTKIETGWSTTKSKKSIDGNTLSVGGSKFTRGVGTHAISRFMLKLDKKGISFKAQVGVDDETGTKGTIQFYVIGDKSVIWESGLMKGGDKAKNVDVSLSGIDEVAFLVTDGGDGIDSDHADWCDAKIEYIGDASPTFVDLSSTVPDKFILTPEPAETPRINGAKIIGNSPNKPFLFRIPATGAKPITFGAESLPQGLTLDHSSGIISGTVANAGEYDVTLLATNAKGSTTRNLRIVIGEGKLSLTPPMGWNSWNCWGLSVSADKVKASVDAMISSGLVNHGWTYINIDDGWEAPARALNGEIVTNEKFPDMKNLSDYVHARGLKLGIYSSPGTLTCGGYLGSLNHEEQDAATYAKWGIDYLKYDWCSYGQEVPSNPSLAEHKKPYIIMRDALKKQNRDIVHSLCQYGMANVWEWGAEVGQLWRTTGDITDTWQSLYSIGFSQNKCAAYTKPGNWNDPDMLIVGKVGWSSSLHDTRLTSDEQYTHISLWSLLSSPLLIGCDMSQLDPFTLNLLTNDEVIEVNQDILGKPARRISKNTNQEVWVKELEDGSLAVGLFYIGQSKQPREYFVWGGVPEHNTSVISVSWADLGISGEQVVRDLWRQKDLGGFTEKFEVEVPYHGVSFVKISPVK
ncbi:MAG: NPCBM/NEW2 domain-containing protein [Bacteroidales bacterium]|nr:NPCBM/NEW2 domain-containing protein [Bacteroidales bacterium]